MIQTLYPTFTQGIKINPLFHTPQLSDHYLATQLSSNLSAAVTFPDLLPPPGPTFATPSPPHRHRAKAEAMTKKGKEPSVATQTQTDADFLPLEGGPARKLPKGGEGQGEGCDNKATVLYIGRLPHGFYEDEIEGFFKHFGTVKRVKVARNRKTGKSKHYGFIEFEYPKVAEVVAGCMNNYLVYEHLLQVRLVPPERVHPKLWKGVNRRHKQPVDFVQIERIRHNKDRTLEEHSKLLKTILKRDKKRRSKIAAAGIDYECPEVEGAILPAPKKIKFDD